MVTFEYDFTEFECNNGTFLTIPAAKLNVLVLAPF